ncbi:hypothetical protein [Actinomyces vulturis]|uniref:hypothetical protein n=1 Tax=Actinomyces vulturis TaxID=1857645 RepID=UPI000830A0D0|nr:hypothetical protein [Actinomyces vulturis]
MGQKEAFPEGYIELFEALESNWADMSRNPKTVSHWWESAVCPSMPIACMHSENHPNKKPRVLAAIKCPEKLCHVVHPLSEFLQKHESGERYIPEDFRAHSWFLSNQGEYADLDAEDNVTYTDIERTRFAVQCPFCTGTRLELRQDTVQWLGDKLQDLGISQIPLDVLHRVISERERNR